MNSRIEPFKAEHLQQMELRALEADRMAVDPGALGKAIALAKYGIGVTLFVDDLVVGAFGYYELWPGVYEVWAYPSIHVQKYAMLYLRTVKRCVLALERTFKPHRLQTTSFDDELHNRWMTFLGFKCETPNGMKYYCTLKQTFNQWSKTYDWV